MEPVERDVYDPPVTLGELLVGVGLVLAVLPTDPFLFVSLAPLAWGVWRLRRSGVVAVVIASVARRLEDGSVWGSVAGSVVRRIPVLPPHVEHPVLPPSDGGDPPQAVVPPPSSPSPPPPPSPVRWRVSLPTPLLQLWGIPTPPSPTPPPRIARVVEREDRERSSRTTGAMPTRSVRDLVTLLNTEPDAYPHVLLMGNSGSGKTTLAQYLVQGRSGYVVILDPKRPKGWETVPKWSGLPYVSRDKETASWEPLTDALARVVDEMYRRYHVQEEIAEPFPTITVILDEAKVAVEEDERLAEYYRKIVSIGREVGIRLLLISTTDRAGKLGFLGEADSLESFVPIRMGRFADAVGSFDRTAPMYYRAAVYLGEWYRLDGLDQIVSGPFVSSLPHPWPGVVYNCQLPRLPSPAAEDTPTPDPDTALLAQLLTTPVPEPDPAEVRVEAPAEVPVEVEAEVNVEVPVEVEAEVLPRSEPQEIPETAALWVCAEVLPEGSTSTGEDVATVHLGIDTAQTLWRTATDEERTLAQDVVRLYARGVSWTQAITHVTGVRGGRKFQRIARLSRALLTLVRRTSTSS